MSVLLATSAFESHDYDRAIQLLTSAPDPGEFSQLPELLTISLVRTISQSSVQILNACQKITGWNFNTLSFEIHRKKCEVLFAAGLTGGAVTSFLEIDLSAETNSKEETEWVIGKDAFVCCAAAVIDVLPQISGGDVWIN